MFQTTQKHTYLVGTIIEDRAEGIGANRHAGMETRVIDDEHDGAQSKGEREEGWKGQTEQEHGKGIVASEVAAEVIGVGEMTTQSSLKDGEDADGYMLLLHAAPALPGSEDNSDKRDKRSENEKGHGAPIASFPTSSSYFAR